MITSVNGNLFCRAIVGKKIEQKGALVAHTAKTELQLLELVAPAFTKEGSHEAGDQVLVDGEYYQLTLAKTKRTAPGFTEPVMKDGVPTGEVKAVEFLVVPVASLIAVVPRC